MRDKSAITGLVIAFAVLFLYFEFLLPMFSDRQRPGQPPPKQEPRPQRTVPHKKRTAPTQKQPKGAEEPEPKQATKEKDKAGKPIIPLLGEQPLEQNIVCETTMFRVVLTNRGAAIRSVTLQNDYTYPPDDERLRLITEIQKNTPSLTMTHADGLGDLDTVNWEHLPRARDPSASPVVERFRVRIPELGLEITKTFRFYNPGEKDDKGEVQPGRDLRIEIAVKNLGQERVAFKYRLRSAAGVVPEPEGPRRLREEPGRSDEQRRLEQRQSRDVEAVVGTPAGDGVEIDTYSAGQRHKSDTDPIYAGVKNRYFVAVLKPMSSDSEIIAVHIEKISEHNVTADLELKTEWIEPGDTSTKEYMFFVAPRRPDVLGDYSEHGFEELVAYGWPAPVTRLLSWLLQVFRRVTPNYGWAIVLLTICVRAVLHPLSLKTQKSAHKMQKIQPLLNAAKAKYKNDKRQQQQEVMKIMREQGANPLGGCLPMLLQLPVFIGLWRSLYQDVSLRHAPFMLWINDLSKPDNLIVFKSWVMPILGWQSLNLLPLLCAAAMVFQQKSAPKSSDPQVQQQQKIMMIMPVIFAVLLYTMPSGLMIYFLISSLFGMAEQRYIRRRLDALAVVESEAKPVVPVEQKRQKPVPQQRKKRRRRK